MRADNSGLINMPRDAPDGEVRRVAHQDAISAEPDDG